MHRSGACEAHVRSVLAAFGASPDSKVDIDVVRPAIRVDGVRIQHGITVRGGSKYLSRVELLDGWTPRAQRSGEVSELLASYPALPPRTSKVTDVFYLKPVPTTLDARRELRRLTIPSGGVDIDDESAEPMSNAWAVCRALEACRADVLAMNVFCRASLGRVRDEEREVSISACEVHGPLYFLSGIGEVPGAPDWFGAALALVGVRTMVAVHQQSSTATLPSLDAAVDVVGRLRRAVAEGSLDGAVARQT